MEFNRAPEKYFKGTYLPPCFQNLKLRSESWRRKRPSPTGFAASRAQVQTRMYDVRPQRITAESVSTKRFAVKCPKRRYGNLYCTRSIDTINNTNPRCPPGAHALIVGDGRDGEDGALIGALHPASNQGGDGSHCPSSGCCPASRSETLGAALYGGFRRRYGLQRTAEERVAGLLGAVLEHSPSSAVLRLFARMLGSPPDSRGEGEVVASLLPKTFHGPSSHRHNTSTPSVNRYISRR